MQEGIDSNFSEWDFITTGSAGSGSGNGSAGETLARTESNTVQSMTVSRKQANRRAALLRGNRKRRRGRRSAHAGETAGRQQLPLGGHAVTRQRRLEAEADNLCLQWDGEHGQFRDQYYNA
jgi:hypothetical protein